MSARISLKEFAWNFWLESEVDLLFTTLVLQSVGKLVVRSYLGKTDYRNEMNYAIFQERYMIFCKVKKRKGVSVLS
jgi:hypothetical protein